MKKLKEAVSHISSGIRSELTDVKKLKGESLINFSSIFGVKEDASIYYNEYNVIVIDKDVHEIIEGFVSRDSLVLKVEIPEYNVYIWAYAYFNDQLFESYLV